jgi:hypothetical protein
MKNKASGFYADSLEMLLDTMCNVLGAVVFITLALAALAPNSHAPAPEELQHQAAELANTLAAVTASNAVVQAELEQTLLRLQEPRQQFQTNHMHLPNVSRTTRQPWEVIVRYGRVFPLYVFSSTARDGKARNAQTIEWRPAAGNSFRVEPRWGQGEDPAHGVEQMIETFRSHSKTNYYFTFSVYEDSFAAFDRAKETAANLGFQYGWEPWAQNTPLGVSRNGKNIPPQN